MRRRNALHRLISIADDPSDDDDARVRKRVGVAAGYLTIAAPLSLPIQAQGHPLSWLLALGLAVFSVGNLLVLARTRRFERYVLALIGAGTVFVPLATVVGGGVTGSSSGLVWAFLVPAYAIMALGPDRAMPWFIAFLGSVGLMVVVDPFVRAAVEPPPYLLQLIGQAQNAAMPLIIIFLLLRYTDLRRRRAEARVDELLTNAIPKTIAARLKRGESRIAEAYDETTVLFATSSDSRPGRRRRSRCAPSPCWMSCSARSTSSPRPTGLKRSGRSATPTWRSPAHLTLGPITPPQPSSWRPASCTRRRRGVALMT